MRQGGGDFPGLKLCASIYARRYARGRIHFTLGNVLTAAINRVYPEKRLALQKEVYGINAAEHEDAGLRSARYVENGDDTGMF